MDKIEYKSKFLNDGYNTQVLLCYDENYFSVFTIVDKEVSNGIQREEILEQKTTCINFSEDELRYEIDEFSNVKFHGIGFENDIIIQEDLYILFYEDDKDLLIEFLEQAVTNLSSLPINKKYDNQYKFESLAKQKHKPYHFFKDKLKELSFKEKLIYSNRTTTDIYEVSKDGKSFVYYAYVDLLDKEFIIKYNDDLQDEVEKLFYYDESPDDIKKVLTIAATILISFIIIMVYLYG